MNKKAIYSILIFCLVIIFLVGVFGAFGLIVYFRTKVPPVTPPIINPKPPVTTNADFVQFSDETEFQTYISANQNNYRNYYSSGLGMGDMMLKSDVSESTPSAAPTADGGGMVPDRFSSTNVQVKGIDEPDIVKTNGTEIFFSPEYFYDYFWEESVPLTSEPMIAPEYRNFTQIISALPVDTIKKLSEIEQNGQLLLIGDNLIIVGYDTIYAYNVADPAKPLELWKYTLNDYNSTFYQTRSYADKLYVVTQTNLYDTPACPIPLLKNDLTNFSIACDQIYHPTLPVTTNVTYTVMEINPQTGAIQKDISMIGSYDSSVIYMSENNVYVAYAISGDIVSFFHNFILENSDLFSDSMIVKVTKLNSYDISDAAKLLELQTIMQEYSSSLSQDSKLKLENDLQNSVGEYLKLHKREIESTMINQIDLANFELKATGSIPGTLLNSFSMDEYNNSLRVATTTANNVWGLPINIPNTESINDVYILDKNMKISGSVLDMGAGERIYSARFVGNLGYVVTFKETDPFYVLDLSNPSNPKKVGELKIPGYSSYLHPISDKLILGVGKEDENVKLSLFDVSNPGNPTEVAKYNLKEYWTDILSTHHAFLLDDKHQVFFVPGSNGGYIFDYSQNKLELVKAVDSIAAQRAIYINDNMYIIGRDKIIVLDEKTWERVKEFNLR